MVTAWSNLEEVSLKTWLIARGIMPLYLKLVVLPDIVKVFPAPVYP